MLVIADQAALGVAGKGGLAGAGEAEEQRGITLDADIGAAMHRQHALCRQQPVHHGEDALLDLTGVAGAGDQDGALREAEGDAGGAAAAIHGRVRLILGRVQDGEVRREAIEVGHHWPDEHVAREQRVPGIGGDQPHADAVRGVRPGIEVLGEQHRPRPEPAAHLGGQALELFRIHLLIDAAPPDFLGGGGIIHHELVLHRAARMHAGDGDEGAIRRKPALTTGECVLHQRRRRQVGVHRVLGGNAGSGQDVSCGGGCGHAGFSSVMGSFVMRGRASSRNHPLRITARRGTRSMPEK